EGEGESPEGGEGEGEGETGPGGSTGEGEGESPEGGEGEGEGEGETPSVGDDCQNVADCYRSYSGLYEVGDDLCLSVPCPVAPDATYLWTRNGVPIEEDERIAGVTERTLRILQLTTADSGVYRCVYDSGMKADEEYAAFVTVANFVPAAGLAALGALGAALGLLGAYAARRQRRE
ncbi:MAG TPA: hypothetical protein PKI11_13290, partial [Candidatus Hydrogenedentes bacterium]|nr:hypothetical protein [Candidatus Hydrogenedentota bacterium]